MLYNCKALAKVASEEQNVPAEILYFSTRLRLVGYCYNLFSSDLTWRDALQFTNVAPVCREVPSCADSESIARSPPPVL